MDESVYIVLRNSVGYALCTFHMYIFEIKIPRRLQLRDEELQAPDGSKTYFVG